MKLNADVWVDAPPETVWDVMLDLKGAPRFVPLLLTAEPLDDAPEVGSQVRMTFGRGERRLTTVATVTHFVPPRHLALQADVDDVDVSLDIEWRAEPKDGGTLVRQAVEARFHTMIARLGARALFSQAEAKQREALDRFKVVAEAEVVGRRDGTLSREDAAVDGDRAPSPLSEEAAPGDRGLDGDV